MSLRNLLLTLSPQTHWKRFCALIALFVLARGVLLLCILPPLEGWDEYQHIAYIQFLTEHGEPPVLRQSKVSRALLEQLVAFPQPRLMVEQVHATGAMDYHSFFQNEKTPSYRNDHGDIPIYQAQQGTLYYQVMRPFFVLAGGIQNLSQSIGVLRGINLLLTVVALLGCLWLIGEVTDNKIHASLIALVVSCQPLFLLNGCRIANDALAVLLGICVVIWALRPHWHKKIGLAVLIGCLLGLGIWAKAIVLSLLPFFVACLALSTYQKIIRMKHAVVVASLVLIVAGVVSTPNFLFNLRHYNMFTPMQEALVNREHGKGLSDLFAAGWKMHLPHRLYKLWLRHSTWVGGWSFLRPRHIRNPVWISLLIGMAGWGYHFLRRSRRSRLLFNDETFSLRCSLLVVFVSIGLSWHMMHSYVAWHGAATNPWYACLAFPFALALVYEGASRWSYWIAILFGWVMTSSYLFAELYGTTAKMLPCYSGGATGLKAVQRIASFHPSWLGITTLLGAMLTCLLTLVVIVATWLLVVLSNRRRSPVNKPILPQKIATKF